MRKLLALCAISFFLFGFDYTGQGADGFTAGEQVSPENMNELDSENDRNELRSTQMFFYTDIAAPIATGTTACIVLERTSDGESCSFNAITLHPIPNPNSYTIYLDSLTCAFSYDTLGFTAGDSWTVRTHFCEDGERTLDGDCETVDAVFADTDVTNSDTTIVSKSLATTLTATSGFIELESEAVTDASTDMNIAAACSVAYEFR